MTDSLYFDTDCISAFLWVSEEHILASLYSGRIGIPQQVYIELSYPGTPQLKARADVLIASGDAAIAYILTGSPDYDLYSKLTSIPDEGHSIIGKGEAAVIALANSSGGIVASNNLKDVASYVSELGLRHITTGDIMVKALAESLITEADGNTIWSAMLAKKRKIGAVSFSEYLRLHQCKHL